ncbi:hypothetical protein HNO88_000275 [Novosphingobium chloroacetimidivorans]|uniref:Uncharacterized protein n=1 Tax=Novosphingobium chloroacetimidivorans TaxID=1428314 RepID=A0A7W7K7E0_9SPHN|nr:hypothetical protein [Novosphingobium chloroacetimidivorans]MBB4856978.1 hypothetical protein [Novosphingobium chloroacetimidivorans]
MSARDQATDAQGGAGERPISEHPCHGLFRTAGDKLSHRHWFQNNQLMPTCERCGTPIDREHNEVGPVSWTSPHPPVAPLPPSVANVEAVAKAMSALDVVSSQSHRYRNNEMGWIIPDDEWQDLRTAIAALTPSAPEFAPQMDGDKAREATRLAAVLRVAQIGNDRHGEDMIRAANMLIELTTPSNEPANAASDEAGEKRRYITLWRKPDAVLDWEFHVSENDHELQQVVGNLRKRPIKQGTTYVLGKEVPELSPAAILGSHP